MILLDTCALLWWTLSPERLSDTATSACAKIADRGGFISSITVWEVGIKWRRNKIDLAGMDILEYVRRLQETKGLEIIPVSESIWAANIMLDWEHRDPADRTIVATATMHNLPIVTKDDNIADFYDRVIW